MKKIKMLFSLSAILLTSILFGIVGHCDVLDDLCEKYDYKYRWTIEVALDSTYKNTWIYDISDNGNIKITFIQFDDKIKLSNHERNECFVFEGKEAYIVDSINSHIAEPLGIWIPDGDTYTILEPEDTEYPFYEEYHEHNGYLKYKPQVVYYYGLNGDFTQQYIIISYYGMQKLADPKYTPIYIDSSTLAEIEDTEEIANLKKGTKSTALPKTDLLKAKGITRVDMKKPRIPRNIALEEQQSVFEADVEYDVDEIAHSKECSEIKAISTDSGELVNIEGVKYNCEVLNGRVDYSYYINRPMGTAEFDVTVPTKYLNTAVSTDGNLHITIEMYMRHVFDIDDAKAYGEDMKLTGKRQPVAIISFKGNKGEEYGYSDLRGYYAYPETWESYPGINASALPLKDTKTSRIIREMINYDGNVLLVKHSSEDSNLPELYIGFFGENGELTTLGLEYDDGTLCKADISEIKIDSEVELAFTKYNWCDSEYLAKPVVEQARDERGAVDYNPDIMFIPVPEEPQGEPVLNPDLPLAPEEGDIRVTIGGRELSFDVAPMIENERVLVPLRAVFENLGADVTWDGETEIITITGNDVHIQFAIDKTDVSVNDETKYMDAPARIVEDRTLVPLRFLSEELGYTVTWDEESRLVTID